MIIEQVNNEPPIMPGDTRPVTYRLTPEPGLNSPRTAFAGDLGTRTGASGASIQHSTMLYGESYGYSPPSFTYASGTWPAS
jgi:hypothetical protein